MRVRALGITVSTQALVILTTCADSDEAERLAALLVERRLAACVNRVHGVASTFRWQGAVDRSAESLLVIKTTAACYPAVERAIRELSSYELPEVLALPAVGGSSEYLKWIETSVHSG